MNIRRCVRLGLACNLEWWVLISQHRTLYEESNNKAKYYCGRKTPSIAHISETLSICNISFDLLRHENMNTFPSIRTYERQSYVNFPALALPATHLNISVTQILYYS